VVAIGTAPRDMSLHLLCSEAFQQEPPVASDGERVASTIVVGRRCVDPMG
jgi:hypothetical protein